MHGELVFQLPPANDRVSVPGNATIEDDETVTWEFHDRDLSEELRLEFMEALAALRGSGQRVQLVFVDSSPPLAEVESGPEVALEQTGPLEYEVVEVDADRATARLRQVPAG